MGLPTDAPVIARHGDCMTTSPVVDSILSARYLRRGEKSFEEICRRVAAALAEDEDDRVAFYEAMSSLRFLPNSPTLMNAGHGDRPALGLLHPARPRLDRGDLRQHEVRRDHPQDGRRDRVQLLADPARGLARAVHGRRRLGPDLVHPGLQRGHRRDQAGRASPRSQHGDPERLAPGYPGVHRHEARGGRRGQLQSLGHGRRSLHGPRRQKGVRGRLARPSHHRRIGHGRRDLDGHRGRDLAKRGAGGPLLRRDQPAQPDAAARRDRHHEPLRRAAAPPVRELRPREHQPGRLRPRRGDRPGRGRGHRPDGRPVPRPRHRPERLPDPADRGGDQADPEDRPRGHGGPRRHADAGSPVRLRRGAGLVRGGDGADHGRGRGRIAPARGGARAVPGRRGERLASSRSGMRR